jgi:putative oxidoreductase
MTAPITPVARILLAGMFVHGGYATLLDPHPRAEAAAPLLARIRAHVPSLPGDECLVRANAVVHVAAGLALAVGIAQHTAAAALAASLIPTTTAGHPWWEHHDPATRAAEFIQATKNAAAAAGLLLLAWPGDRR